MIYELINKPKRIETALIDRAVLFACEYLKLDIDLVVEFETLQKYQCGFCDYDEEYNEAIVTVAKRLSQKEIIRTIFHELVHVKQYESGKLQNGSPQRWLGVAIEDKYENLPWELEAFDLEERMMRKFYGSN